MDIQATSGIYQITNLVNGRVYYGSSKNIKTRFMDHKTRLRSKHESHRNNLLQNDWDLFGEKAFKFELIIYCNRYLAKKWEQQLLDWFWDNQINCYNNSPSATGPIGPIGLAKISASLKGHPCSADTRAKISIANKGKKRSSELVVKLAASNKGRKQSPEAIAKTVIAHKGAKRSLESRLRMSAAQKGKKQSPEAVAKRVASLKGRKHPPESFENHSRAMKKRWAIIHGESDEN